MTIQPISDAALALYLSPAELRERGLRFDAITAEHTLTLTREALRQAGLSLREPLEVETWPDKSGLLIFVRAAASAQTVWSFARADDLLDAARALHAAPPDNALYWWDDRFWLITEGDFAPLAEFGQQEADDPCLAARLREYGAALLAPNALAQIRGGY